MWRAVSYCYLGLIQTESVAAMATMMRASWAHPSWAPASSTFPIQGSTGSPAKALPTGSVSLPVQTNKSKWNCVQDEQQKMKATERASKEAYLLLKSKWGPATHFRQQPTRHMGCCTRLKDDTVSLLGLCRAMWRNRSSRPSLGTRRTIGRLNIELASNALGQTNQ